MSVSVIPSISFYFYYYRNAKILNNHANGDAQAVSQESAEVPFTRTSKLNHSFDTGKPITQLPSCLKAQRKSKSLISIHTDSQSDLPPHPHKVPAARPNRKHTTIVLPQSSLAHNDNLFDLDRARVMRKHYSIISKPSVIFNLRSRHVSPQSF